MNQDESPGFDLKYIKMVKYYFIILFFESELK